MSKTKVIEKSVGEIIPERLSHLIYSNIYYKLASENKNEMLIYINSQNNHLCILENKSSSESAVENFHKQIGGALDFQLISEFEIHNDDDSADDGKIRSKLVGEDLSTLITEKVSSIQKAVESKSDEVDLQFEDECISAKEASNLLNVDKSTVTRRIDKGEIIGFQEFKRELRIPKDQFKGNNLALGIKEMIKMFDGDHKETWFFLSSPIFYGDKESRPIDRLRALKREADLPDCLAQLEIAKDSHDLGDHF